MVSTVTTTYIYIPLVLIISLSKPSRVLHGPVVHISGMHLPMTFECSFSSETNILEKGLIGLQLFLCPLTKSYTILKIIPMQFLV